jgi:hypothetical protein
MLLKRNNLTVEGRKPRTEVNPHGVGFQGSEKPSIFKKMETDLGVSDETVNRDFRQVSQRAKAVARAEGKPEPKAIKPTSSAQDIETVVELSERHGILRDRRQWRGQPVYGRARPFLDQEPAPAARNQTDA